MTHSVSSAASLGLLSLLLASAPAHAAPQGGQVISGSASISQSGSTTTISQTSQNVSLGWQRFNVGTAETVNFIQPSASAIAVNRIYDTQGSQILGRINANGQVWLINPNGVLFGRDAQINVGALVASTLDVADGDLANSTRRFGGNSSASVVNQGRITAALGGYVSLLGHQVINQGSISAQLGTVALGAGNAISLNFSGSRLLGLQIEQSQLNALADNGGLIQASGGQVLLSAGARDSLLASAVNNSGVIEATTVQEEGGTIVLLAGMAAGTTTLGGTLNASAPNGGNGGFIETSAHSVQITDGARITTLAPQGRTGTWLIDPTDFTVAAGSAALTTSGIGADTLSTSLGGSNVTIATDNVNGTDAGDINVNAAVSWAANKLTLSAWNNININAALNGSATASLAFEYGKGAVSAGNTSTYSIHAPVSLPAGDNFSTKLGSDGAVLGWKVITALGAEGSTTGTDLQGINGGLTGRYVLGSDIDATATSSWNAGAGFAPIGNNVTPFTGSFDGLGHSISGLTINRPGEDRVGLFGFAANNAGQEIRNVGLTDVAITGGFYVGGLVGVSLRGTIVSNSYATGSVSGSGGIGGLVGYSYYGRITNSYATGIVSGNVVGGLVGESYSEIVNSYAMGRVSGMNYVGGLVGSNNRDGTITNSYATGSVTGTGSNFGGLVGFNALGGAVSNSFWDTTTSGQAMGIGGGTQTGATGLTTAQLAAALPNGFSPSVWGNGDNQTTPYLLSHAVFSSTSGSVILGSDASATPTAYQVILNATQLQNINTTGLADNYVLGSNVDATATSAWNAGAGFVPIGTSDVSGFTGSFDGLGHTIGHLTINRPTTDNVGLFEVVGAIAVIRNVGLADVAITGQGVVGGLVGLNHGTVTSSFASGRTGGSGDYVGGLVGYNDGAITNSYATGSVDGVNGVGGLVGVNGGTINNSYATSSVVGSSPGFSVGGLVGLNNGGAITDSYATGRVDGGYEVGGLVGANSGTVTNSYATGHVSATSSVGGLAGVNDHTISNSFWDTTTSGQAMGIGGGTQTGAIGLTTADTYTGANFTPAGWDFTNTWVMYEGHTAPLLRSFMAPLTVTADNATAPKVYDGSTTYLGGTATYSVTTDSRLLGTLTYTQDSKDAGSRTITPGGLWSDQQGYLISYESGSLTINKAHLTVTSDAQSRLYGAANPTFTTTVSGFVNSENLASAGVTGSGAASTAATTATGVGSATITSGAGSLSATNYDFTNLVNGALTISKAHLTVTADNAGKTYGDVNPALTTTVSGFVNGELLGTSGVSGLGAASTLATASTGAGTATITAGAGSLSATNYDFTNLVNGALTISKAHLTVTADNAGKTYGDVNPALTTTVSGFVNGELLGTSGVSGLGAASTLATASTGAGTATITAGAGSLSATNYDFTNLVNGALTINQRPISVTADANSKTYGNNDPALTYTVTSGSVVNGDSLGTLGRDAGENVGSYAINATALANGNYLITANNGALSISKAHLTVTADNASKTYGDANPVLAATVSGFVNGEVLGTSGVSGSGAASTLATTATGAGTATITAGAGTLSAGNYDFANLVNGTLTIGQRAISVSADAKSKTYGNNDPTLTYTVTSGSVVNSDSLGTLSRSAGENVGSYTINASALANGNYLITANNGALSISKAHLTVTANNASKTYGDANPALSATVSGFVNGEVLGSSGVSGSGAATTLATATTGVGMAAITASAGDLTAANYDFTSLANGTLTINQRATTQPPTTPQPTTLPPTALPPEVAAAVAQLFGPEVSKAALQFGLRKVSGGVTSIMGITSVGEGVQLPPALSGDDE